MNEPSFFHGLFSFTCFFTVLSWWFPQTGIYNFCNPGAISHNQVLELYRDLTMFIQRKTGVGTDFRVFLFLLVEIRKKISSVENGDKSFKNAKTIISMVWFMFLWYSLWFDVSTSVRDFSIAGGREGLYWPRLQVGQLHHRRTGQGDHRSTLQQWAEPTQDVEGLALRFALSMWLEDVKVGEWFNDVSARALQIPNQFFFFGDDARLLHLW